MKTKVLGGFLMAFMSLLNLPLSAGATSTVLGDNPNSPHSISITREISGVTNPVSNSFEYEIFESPDNPDYVSGLDTHFWLDMSFVEPSSDNVAMAQSEIDFSSVTFNTLGDYSFVIREIDSSNPVVYPVDEGHEFLVLVSVRNEIVNGSPTGNYEANLALQAIDGDTGDKSDIVFNSEAQMTYIELSKDVSGNMARTDEYFKFLITFDDLELGDRFVVVGQDEEIEYDGEYILTDNEYVVGGNNAIYLRHGQTVTIGLNGDLYQLPVGASYSISEVSDGDYVVYANGVQRTEVGPRIMEALQDGELTAANKTAFVNHKESEVLTGITMTLLPFSLLALLSLIGYVAFRKLHKEEHR